MSEGVPNAPECRRRPSGAGAKNAPSKSMSVANQSKVRPSKAKKAASYDGPESAESASKCARAAAVASADAAADSTQNDGDGSTLVACLPF